MPNIDIDFTDYEDLTNIKIERLDNHIFKFVFTETFESFVEGSITTILLSNNQFNRLLKKMNKVKL